MAKVCELHSNLVNDLNLALFRLYALGTARCRRSQLRIAAPAPSSFLTHGGEVLPAAPVAFLLGWPMLLIVSICTQT